MADITWWGHSFSTVELPGVTVATDPLMVRRLFHLKRATAPPPSEATRCDLVLISHLHHDHLHMPSLRRFDDDVPIVVPRGSVSAVKSLERLNVIEVAPGDRLTVAGTDIEVLAADHHEKRLKTPGSPAATPIGFRFTAGGQSCWYPGDTGMMDFSPITSVDLALVPIGGWGPSLADGHIDPEQAVEAVSQVGARWAVPVHYGTFWPVVLRSGTDTHRHWFRSPAERFTAAAAAAAGLESRIVIPEFGVPTALRWPA